MLATLSPTWRDARFAALVGTVLGVLLIFLSVNGSPLKAILAIVGISVVIAIIYMPTLGFFLTSAVIPLERIGRLTGDSSIFTISLMRVIGAVTVTSLLLHMILKRKSWKMDLTIQLYIIYIAICAVTLFVSTDFTGTVRALGQIVVNLVFFVLVINMVKDMETIKIALAAWLLATVLVGLYTTYDWHYGTHTVSTEFDIGNTDDRFVTVWIDNTEWENKLSGIKRAMGTTSHAAVYGINLIMTLPFFAYFFRSSRKLAPRILIGAAAIVVAYNIVLTNTRSVMLVAGFTFVLCWLVGLVKLRIRYAVVIAVLAAGVIVYFNPKIFQRVLNLQNYSFSQSRTAQIRFEYWQAGLEIVRENFLIGIGVGNKNEVPRHVKGDVPDQTTVHNEYLQTLMEVGIIGWIVFFAFVGTLLAYAFKATNIFRVAGYTEGMMLMQACMVCMTACLVYALQCDLFRFPLKGWWLVAGITVAVYGMQKANVREGATNSLVEG